MKVVWAAFYRVDVYPDHKLFKKNMQSQHDKKYDPKICELYQSHQGGKGREVATNKRKES
jgi:zona occludens toxin (predicted ATPase)